jgi:hypothetical protein
MLELSTVESNARQRLSWTFVHGKPNEQQILDHVQAMEHYLTRKGFDFETEKKLRVETGQRLLVAFTAEEREKEAGIAARNKRIDEAINNHIKKYLRAFDSDEKPLALTSRFSDPLTKIKSETLFELIRVEMFRGLDDDALDHPELFLAKMQKMTPYELTWYVKREGYTNLPSDELYYRTFATVKMLIA